MLRKRGTEQKDQPGVSDVPEQTRDSDEAGPTSQSQWKFWLILAIVSGVIYLVGPFMQNMFPLIVRYVVYSHRLRIPFFVDHTRPDELNLNHTINMYLTPEEGISLGLWHTVPERMWKEAQGKDLEWYLSTLADGSPVFLYFHGNTNSRAATHRVGVANILSSLGYHVLVPEYRGFADSTGEPTEAGLTSDALYLYHWVKARCGDSPVVMWGHSLGTGVSTNTAVKLIEQGIVVDGVIIEGAFPYVLRENAIHPLRWIHPKIPSFGILFADPVNDKEVILPNIDNLRKMRSRLLILHSEDDHLAPIEMARKLYETARESQDPERVRMETFDGSLGYLHNGLYRDPKLPGILREFVESL